MTSNWKTDVRVHISLHLLLILVTLMAISWLATRERILIFSLVGLTLVLLTQMILLFKSLQKIYDQLEEFFISLRHQDTTRQLIPVYHQGKKLAQHWQEIQTDIQNLRERNESLLRYYSLLMEKVPVPLVRIHNNQLELINMAARNLLQCNQTLSLQQLSRFGDDFAQALIALKPGEQRQVSLLHSEQTISLAVSATTIQLQEGISKVISLQVIQRELDKQQVKAWQELVQVLSHEIMNSMTPISSLSKTAQEFLDDYERDPDSDLLFDAKDALATVSRRSEQLMVFLNSYRTVAQSLHLELRSQPLAPLLREVAHLFAAELATANISLKVALIHDELQINADSAQFEQALINLVKNAIEALQESPQLQKNIDVRAYIGASGNLIIDIEDNGPGIPEERRDQVFVPFYTSKRTGTGIGLFLVQQIIQAHGGSVTCITHTGRSCFRMTF